MANRETPNVHTRQKQGIDGAHVTRSYQTASYFPVSEPLEKCQRKTWRAVVDQPVGLPAFREKGSKVSDETLRFLVSGRSRFQSLINLGLCFVRWPTCDSAGLDLKFCRVLAPMEGEVGVVYGSSSSESRSTQPCSLVVNTSA